MQCGMVVLGSLRKLLVLQWLYTTPADKVKRLVAAQKNLR